MKVSLDWLNRYLDPPCELEEASATLTAVGFPDDGRDEYTRADGEVDPVIDFEVTSNRGDCLSHIGLARELAAASDRRLTTPFDEAPQAIEAHSESKTDEFATVENHAEAVCPLYTARVIRDVTVGPSPDWLVQHLEAIGLRSVNNVVDVTNYVLHETGQPLHAFDLNKLAKRRIVVRHANAGEDFDAIDGSKHKLAPDMLVIADAEKPVAVAGVMGGLESEVSGATTDVLLESAIFAPLSVRKTSRLLKLSSDSSYRFERGVDPLGVEEASRRAAAMIVELAGGRIVPGVLETGGLPETEREVSMRADRCNALLGLQLADEDMALILDRLGLSPMLDGGTITCAVPTFRLDLRREVDLIEEVARHHGLDNIAVREKIQIVTRPTQDAILARQRLGSVLIAHGYHETITPSFMSKDHAQPFVPILGPDHEAELMGVSEDRRKTDPWLRPSVMPSLLICRKFNQDRGNASVKLFETAAVWARCGGNAFELNVVSLLADADDAQHSLRMTKGTVVELVAALGGEAMTSRLSFEPVDDPRFAVAARVCLDGTDHGRVGLASEEILDRFGLQTPVVLAEIDRDPLLALYPPATQINELPRFPGIERDLSIIVDEAVAWRQIDAAIQGVAPALLENVSFIGTYRGKPITKGRKSVSLRLLFRDPDQTLRHDAVDPQVAAVVAALTDAAGAELRS